MSQRLTAEEKRYQKRQASVGLASNVLGITAGTAALGAAAKNKAFKNPAAKNAGPVTSRLSRKMKLSSTAQKRLILAGAGGAVGLQAANLGGDLVTNRVLFREVKKNDMSMISKAEGAVSSNGHGKSLVDKAQRRFDPEADRQRRIGMYSAGGALGAVYLGDKARGQLAREGARVIKPKGKKGALLSLGALASGALGAGAYKRGVDVRNQPWT